MWSLCRTLDICGETDMNVLVTGASGFIGQHLVPVLLERGHRVIAVGRSRTKARSFSWFSSVHFIAHDLHKPTADLLRQIGRPDALVNLAWQGLPNYSSLFHFEENLPAHYHFLKAMVNSGVDHILVTGTCFEYGMKSGPLAEHVSTDPANPYALAKDTLRRFLQALAREQPFRMQWVRIFYMYGPGQNPNSLLGQLDSAIARGDPFFNMSGGEQLRDYSPVREVAQRLAWLVEHSESQGVINCCSGKPTSVRGLVDGRIAECGSSIKTNLGYYPYPDYEPMAFWGCPDKLAMMMKGLP